MTAQRAPVGWTASHPFRAFRWFTCVLSIALLPAACTKTGSFEDQKPGQDQQLYPGLIPGLIPGFIPGFPFLTTESVGALAVEKDESHVWLVHGGTMMTSPTQWITRAMLAAVDPTTGLTTDMIDVSKAHDCQIVFPGPQRALVLTWSGSDERLDLLDTSALQVIRHATIAAEYGGPRTSPSGRFLVVADISGAGAPIHAIDTSTLDHVGIPHDGQMIQAMWDKNSDRLVAITMTSAHGLDSTTHLLIWDPDQAGVSPWPAPTTDVALHGYQWDSPFFFYDPASSTWIGISPDDRWAVFSVLRTSDGGRVLLVMNQQDGTIRTVPGQGPVAFTPDGSTIVSYGYGPSGEAVLYIIDVATLATKQVPIPGMSEIYYFATWDGTYVVVTAATGGNNRIVIYDPIKDASSVLEAMDPMELNDFVTRPGHGELWLASGGNELYRLQLEPAEIDTVDIGMPVRHLNILPTADRLVASPPIGPEIRFVDLADQKVSLIATLPSVWAGSTASVVAIAQPVVMQGPPVILTKRMF